MGAESAVVERSVVWLDRELIRAAKTLAAAGGTTIGEVIEAAAWPAIKAALADLSKEIAARG